MAWVDNSQHPMVEVGEPTSPWVGESLDLITGWLYCRGEPEEKGHRYEGHLFVFCISSVLYLGTFGQEALFSWVVSFQMR